VIEDVQPQVSGGRFPIKRTVGETIDVTGHVHADGHDLLMVRLRYRSRGRGTERPWCEVAMELLGNDEWRASFQVDEIGEYEYTVEAWVDRFLSWRHGLEVKVRAGMDVATELQEGAVPRRRKRRRPRLGSGETR
jgi:starch synthase (maltosyl-transferring)